MTKTEFLAFPMAEVWHDFWHGEVGEWILSRGLSIVLLLIGAVLTARFISWTAQRISRRGVGRTCARIHRRPTPSLRGRIGRLWTSGLARLPLRARECMPRIAPRQAILRETNYIQNKGGKDHEKGQREKILQQKGSS